MESLKKVISFAALSQAIFLCYLFLLLASKKVELLMNFFDYTLMILDNDTFKNKFICFLAEDHIAKNKIFFFYNLLHLLSLTFPKQSFFFLTCFKDSKGSIIVCLLNSLFKNFSTVFSLIKYTLTQPSKVKRILERGILKVII